MVEPMQVISEARAGGYAVGAFNMHSEETTEALVQAAEQAASPVFLQVGRAIVPHMGLRRAFEMTKRIAEESNAEFVIHLDHGPWEEVFQAIRLGFTSLMYDGAHLPFEENIRTTRKVVEVAHEFGIPVEAELGKIPDADQKVDWSAYYTDVAEAGVSWPRPVWIYLPSPWASSMESRCRTPSPWTSSGSRRLRLSLTFRWYSTGPRVYQSRRSGTPLSPRCISSTPIPICGTRSGQGSKRYGRRETASLRRRSPRAGTDDCRDGGEDATLRVRWSRPHGGGQA